MIYSYVKISHFIRKFWILPRLNFTFSTFSPTLRRLCLMDEDWNSFHVHNSTQHPIYHRLTHLFSSTPSPSKPQGISHIPFDLKSDNKFGSLAWPFNDGECESSWDFVELGLSLSVIEWVCIVINLPSTFITIRFHRVLRLVLRVRSQHPRNKNW